MMLALTLLMAQAASPPSEPQGELPAAASIHARKVPSARPNGLENSLTTPGSDVSADDVVDEMVDEFAVDIARLGAAQISPILLQRVRVSANMNPEYAHVFESAPAATSGAPSRGIDSPSGSAPINRPRRAFRWPASAAPITSPAQCSEDCCSCGSGTATFSCPASG